MLTALKISLSEVVETNEDKVYFNYLSLIKELCKEVAADQTSFQLINPKDFYDKILKLLFTFEKEGSIDGINFGLEVRF